MTKNNSNRTPKRKRVVGQASDKISLRLDPILRHIIEAYKLRAPPESGPNDSKIVRYMILEMGRNQRQKIISKIQEYDDKLQHWQEKLRDYDKVSEELQ